MWCSRAVTIRVIHYRLWKFLRSVLDPLLFVLFITDFGNSCDSTLRFFDDD